MYSGSGSYLGKGVALALVLLLILTGYFLLRTSGDKPLPKDIHTFLTAVAIDDGDTFTSSNEEKIRLLGIDTPEMGEPYYDEAKQYLSQLVYHEPVRLETDKRKRDRYGRLLAYVFSDDLFVNELIIKAGLASVYIFPKDMKNTEYLKKLIDAQKYARENYRGIWSLEPDIMEDEYIGNKNTYRFHRPSCSSVDNLKDKYKIVRMSRDDFLDMGYSPCRNCKP